MTDENASAPPAEAESKPAEATPETLDSPPAAEPSPGETPDAPDGAPEQAGAKKPDGDGEAEADRKHGTAKLIRRLKGRLKAVEAERDALRQAAEAALRRAETAREPSKPEPKQDDFGSYEEFIDALVSHRVEQRLAAERSRDEEPVPQDLDEVRRQAERKAATDSWAEQVAEFKKQHPDFEAKVFDPALPITAPMAEVLMRAEDGAEVAYWLANHPDVCAEIASLNDPVSIALAIGQATSARGSQPPAASPGGEQQASPAGAAAPGKAPPVIEPVSSAGSGTAPNPERMDIQSWMKWRWRNLAE